MIYLGENAKQYILDAGIEESEISEYISVDKFKEALEYDKSKYNLEALEVSKDDNYDWSVSYNNDEIFEIVEGVEVL